jgi:hypothetical protein
MNPESIPDNPYLLLTSGPLSTTKSVRTAMPATHITAKRPGWPERADMALHAAAFTAGTPPSRCCGYFHQRA